MTLRQSSGTVSSATMTTSVGRADFVNCHGRNQCDCVALMVVIAAEHLASPSPRSSSIQMLDRQLFLSGDEADPAAGFVVGVAASLYWMRSLHQGDSECQLAETATVRDEQSPEEEMSRDSKVFRRRNFSGEPSLPQPWWSNIILLLKQVCVHRRRDTGIFKCRWNLYGCCPSSFRRPAEDLEATLSPDKVYGRRPRASVREARHHISLRLSCRRSNQ